MMKMIKMYWEQPINMGHLLICLFVAEPLMFSHTNDSYLS